jgi:hypothetical protein
MKPITNWNDIQTSGDFKALEPGGYVIKIETVTDNEAKKYLDIIYDIAEGPEKGRYADDWGKDHPYAHRLVRSYKESALGMFKGFIKAVDESNGTNFSEQAKTGINEKELVGKIVGVVIGQEEYQNDYGDIKLRLTVRSVKSAQDIREGKYNIPDVKKLKDEVKVEAPEGFVHDDDLPF